MKKPLIAVTQMSKPSDEDQNDQQVTIVETNHTDNATKTALASQG